MDNAIRSKSYSVISMNDKFVKLTHKETREVFYAYQNIYGRIWFLIDDIPIFIQDEKLENYDIVEVTNN